MVAAFDLRGYLFIPGSSEYCCNRPWRVQTAVRLCVLFLLALLLWTVPVAGREQYAFQGQDATPAETVAHITAQESVVYVGESVNFTCSTKSRDIPKHVAWLMYEEDMSAASFVTITTSEAPAGNGLVLFISTLTIIKALFNHTSIIRCRIKVNAQTVLYLSTPLTVSPNTTQDGKRIGDQCTANEKCPLEHSTCKPNNAESTSGTCQCDTEHPVLSNRNDVGCLQAAGVDEPCVDSAQCQYKDDSSQCEDQVCRCKTGFSLEQGRCVVKIDGALCKASNACVDPNAECVSGHCVCRTGFASNPNTKLCDLSSDQEFQLAVIGVSSVAVLLVVSGITAACFVLYRRKNATSPGRY